MARKVMITRDQKEAIRGYLESKNLQVLLFDDKGFQEVLRVFGPVRVVEVSQEKPVISNGD